MNVEPKRERGQSPSGTVPKRFAGIMSGTSADGIDVAVVDIVDVPVRPDVTLLAFSTVAYPEDVRAEVLRLGAADVAEPEALMRLDVVLGELFADALLAICDKARIEIDSVDLVGSHGQTVRHRPGAFHYRDKSFGATLQLGQPEVIRERTGRPTVSHFRQADMAAGGQGAPLVPMPDWLLLGSEGESRLLLNVGGIANLTWLPAGCKPEQVLAFDTGPGNMAIDNLVARLTGGAEPIDRDGARAGAGAVDQDVLGRLMQHPYFDAKPPKSTGREQFGAVFVEESMRVFPAAANPDDLIATATALTARSVADAISRFIPGRVDRLLVAGGGVHNRTLMAWLADAVAPTPVESLSSLGFDPDAREAVAFALLAWLTSRSRPGNIPAATGASKSVILGRLCP